ncbi:TraR/DksA C4-type zinc finger protein [Streptomyces sp. NPDC054802]
MVAKKTADNTASPRSAAAGAETGTPDERATRPRKAAKKTAGGTGAARKTPAKESSAKKAPAKRASAVSAATEESTAERTTPTKTTPTKTTPTKTTARKTAAEKAAARETSATKKSTATKKAAAKKSGTATKTTAKTKKQSDGAPRGAKRAGADADVAPGPVTKEAVDKAVAAKQAAPAAEGAAEAAEQTGARTVAAKKTAGRASGAGASAVAVPTARTAATTPPGELAVRPGEDPWTQEEVDEARAGLEGEAARLNAEITSSEAALAGLMRDSGDGAGDDEADTGAKNITREHEMALAANGREMLEQTERALQGLDTGTYGLCESCGKAIGKARMQAFPRATLCVECKQKQERRG